MNELDVIQRLLQQPNVLYILFDTTQHGVTLDVVISTEMTLPDSEMEDSMYDIVRQWPEPGAVGFKQTITYSYSFPCSDVKAVRSCVRSMNAHTVLSNGAIKIQPV